MLSALLGMWLRKGEYDNVTTGKATVSRATAFRCRCAIVCLGVSPGVSLVAQILGASPSMACNKLPVLAAAGLAGLLVIVLTVAPIGRVVCRHVKHAMAHRLAKQ